MIDTRTPFDHYFPHAKERLPSFIYQTILALLRTLAHEKRINTFISNHKELVNSDFIEVALDSLGVSYTVSDKDRARIPSTGAVVIVANHPLGGLDALALLKLVTDVRSDVKIVANAILNSIDPIRSMLIPVDTFSSRTPKASVYAIQEALKNENALIIFPSGEVSRATPWGLKDRKWQKGFLSFASMAKAPILPIYIHAQNSLLFYLLSFIYRPLSTLSLPSEMFKKRQSPIAFHVGDTIPYKSYNIALDMATRLKLFKKHLYGLEKKKGSIFVTEKTICAPENRKLIVAEITKNEHLGTTHDGKYIICAKFTTLTPLLKEIGRLRELTFRKVQEGSGEKRDIDHYDLLYHHIVVWDPHALEVVGAYRIGVGSEILPLAGEKGFYTASLFHFSPKIAPLLPTAIELGRSFVQPAYWGSRALDYLWQGVGAFLAKNPHIQTMFGPVSLSASYPQEALSWIIAYYSHYFQPEEVLAHPKNPPKLFVKESIFTFTDQVKDMKILKEHLSCFGLAIPTLYKHYTELCSPNGVSFHSFSVDNDFQECIDGFIVVDVRTILQPKYDRYIGRYLPKG